MSFSIALWVRDTALKLYQQGLDLNRTAVSYVNRNEDVYKQRQQLGLGWDWKPDGKENTDLNWLL